MNAKTHNLTPEQITWGRFYCELHALAEMLRRQETATATRQLTEVTRPGNDTPRHQAKQMEARK